MAWSRDTVKEQPHRGHRIVIVGARIFRSSMTKGARQASQATRIMTPSISEHPDRAGRLALHLEAPHRREGS